MKILLINKFYYRRAGAETALFETKKILEAAGHQVYVFAMKHPKNEECPEWRYFADNIDFEQREGWLIELRKWGRSFYSKEVARKLERLIQELRPDVAHVHNFMHQLTPSIFTVLKKYHVPVVQTLHDFQLVSPAYNLQCRHGYCQPAGAWETVKGRQLKKSFLVSLWAAIEFKLINWWHCYREKVDLFIAPSVFMRDILVREGVTQPIEVLANPLHLEDFEPQYMTGSYAVCISRLIAGKGVKTLIRAVEELEDIPVKIVGDGPLMAELLHFIEKNHVRNVELLGEKNFGEIADLVRQSRLAIFPSELGENNPYGVMEAMAWGKPVIGSQLGGVPELIAHNSTGWLFEAGNYHDLRSTIKENWNQIEAIEEAGQSARKKIEEMNAHYLENIQRLYSEVLDKSLPLG